MKKIQKNLLLGFGVLTSVITPVAAVVACGSSGHGHYEQIKPEWTLDPSDKRNYYDGGDQRYHYTMKYINEYSEKFYSPSKVLEHAFKDAVLPGDFKLPSSIDTIGDGAFENVIFPENCQETFSNINVFEMSSFYGTIIPKSYKPSLNSIGGGGLGGSILWEGFRIPTFVDVQGGRNMVYAPYLPAGLVWFDERGVQVPDNGHDSLYYRQYAEWQLLNPFLDSRNAAQLHLQTYAQPGGDIKPEANWTVGKPRI